MSDDLEKRHQEWLERAEQIDREGLFGDEIRALTPAVHRFWGVVLSVAEVRQLLGFPQFGGQHKRISETMAGLGFKPLQVRLGGRRDRSWVAKPDPIKLRWRNRRRALKRSEPEAPPATARQLRERYEEVLKELEQINRAGRVSAETAPIQADPGISIPLKPAGSPSCLS